MEALIAVGAALLIAVGVLASFIVLLAGAPLFALAVALWETWWLLPLWDWSVVAIGGPAITFGQLLCLQVMVCAFLPRHSALPKEEKSGANAIRLSAQVLTPVAAYYAICVYRWWVA